MMEAEKRYFGGWWIWILVLIVLTLIVLFGLRSAGLIGWTIVERKVFEESYQKKAGDSAKLATFKAQRLSIEIQLRRTDLTAAERTDLEAQLAAINIQIGALDQ